MEEPKVPPNFQADYMPNLRQACLDTFTGHVWSHDIGEPYRFQPEQTRIQQERLGLQAS